MSGIRQAILSSSTIAASVLSASGFVTWRRAPGCEQHSRPARHGALKCETTHQDVKAGGLVTNWGDPTKAAKLEKSYQGKDVVQQRQEILRLLKPLSGERILDIGCGPGFLLQELAAAVEATGHVEGVDPSDVMVSLAGKRLSGSANVGLQAASAEALPYKDGHFDAVIFCQILLYVKDVPCALAEARRVLRPGGRLVICDTDWDSLVSNTSDRARFLQMLEACCSTFADAHLPVKLPGLLVRAGFNLAEIRTVPMLEAGVADRSGGSFAGNWAFNTVPEKARGFGVPEVEVEAWLEEQQNLSNQEAFFACVHRFLFLAHKSSDA